MAQDQQTITLTQTAWTQITNADVTALTFQVLQGSAYIRVTTDATTPTEEHGLLYAGGQGESNITLTDLVNLTGGARVWAKQATSTAAAIFVDHA